MDAGDLLLPKLGPFLSARQRNQLTLKADLIIEAFNQMGCDAVAVGDADLGLGSEFLLKMAKKAHFPFINSNLIDRKTGKPAFKPYVIRELGGLRIGIIGLISQDVSDTRGMQTIKEFQLKDPHLTARKMVHKLRDRVDLIILLSHMGYRGDQLFAQKIRGIDIIVGGHTGAHLCNPVVVGETLILHNSAYGRNVGVIDIDFSKEKASFVNKDTIRSLRETLTAVDERIRALETEKASKQKQEVIRSALEYRAIVEKRLKTYGQENPFRNRIVRLHERITPAPDVLALVEWYKRKLANRIQGKGCGLGSKKIH